MRWLVGIVVTAALAGALSRPAQAQLPAQPGDEIAVGRNATGEVCRLRLVAIGRGAPRIERFLLFCEGWTTASGELRQFRAAPAFSLTWLVTDSPWFASLDDRLAGCRDPEPTTLGGGAPVVVRECVHEHGNWPVVIAAAHVGPRGYTFESLPTNFRVLERAAEILSGTRPPEQPAEREGTVSAAIRRAEAIVGASGRLAGVADIGLLETAWELGERHFRARNVASAETAYLRALEISQRLFGPDHPTQGAILGRIARTVALDGRYAEADALFARALPLVQRSPAIDDHALHLALLAWRLVLEGRFAEALAPGEESLRLRERAPRPSEFHVAHSRAHLALIHRGLKQPDLAADHAERARQVFDRPGHWPEWRAWWGAEVRLMLSDLARAAGRLSEARRYLEDSTRRLETMFGDAPITARNFRLLGNLARLEKDRPRALEAFRRAAEIATRNTPTRDRLRPAQIANHLDLLLQEATASAAETPALLAEVLAVAQLPRDRDTSRALRAMAARVGAGDPALAGVVRDLQDATRRHERLKAAVGIETLGLRDRRQEGREERLKEQLEEAARRIEQLEQQLQARFPRYARFVADRPLGLQDVIGMLAADEALLVLLPTPARVFVLVVRDGAVHAHQRPLRLDDLRRDVERLRASLDLASGRVPAYDVQTAYRLYAALVAPIAARLAGARHLVAVPAGPLLSLPLGALLTAPATPAATGDYRGLPWLGRDVAISVVPSLGALRDLRAATAPVAAPRPFLGVADPAFAGAAGDARGLKALADACRDSGPADVAAVRGLARLPETAVEVRRIAQALGGGDAALLLGRDATEARVRGLPLHEYRVLVFATHGLLPGELRCQSEPALALAPPAAAADRTDDGLLDASEVAQLRLDADWVLLSACNTAGPDGSLGGESLSGLARAFFYAGARAVLASHWAVASVPTVDLTTGIFAALAREPALGKAEALRRSQLAMAAERATSHPSFWAPFVLIGDGAR